MGLKISISFSSFENCLSILESVKDHVTVSKYPFDAKDPEINETFFAESLMFLAPFFQWLINLIFLKPLIRINSSIKSTSKSISVLHEGTSTLISFLPFLQLNPNESSIFELHLRR